MEYLQAILFTLCSLAFICSCLMLCCALFCQVPAAIFISLTGVIITSYIIYKQS